MRIGETKLTSPAADDFFADGAQTYSQVFAATLRYLAVKRSGGITENIKPIEVRQGVTEKTAEGCINFALSVGGDNIENGHITVLVSQPDTEQPKITDDGWTSLNDPPFPVGKFLSSFSRTSIYINKIEKRVIIFVDRISIRWSDMLAATLFRIMPWLYADGEINEEDAALFKAINYQESEKVFEILNSVQVADFTEIQLKKQMLHWGEKIKNQRIDVLKNNIYNAQSQSERYYIAICEEQDKIDRWQLELTAMLNHSGEDGGKEILNFFETHKQLSIKTVSDSSSGGKLIFMITETLEYYDIDEFNKYYENKSSYFYDYGNEDILQIFHGIFSKQKGSFRTISAFSLTNFSSLNAVNINTIPNHPINAIPHPHLGRSSPCLGGNATPIGKYMSAGDWDLAIEQAISATKNINFGDSGVVLSTFSTVNNNMDKKFIVADNGKDMSPKEFLVYLSESKANDT